MNVELSSSSSSCCTSELQMWLTLYAAHVWSVCLKSNFPMSVSVGSPVGECSIRNATMWCSSISSFLWSVSWFTSYLSFLSGTRTCSGFHESLLFHLVEFILGPHFNLEVCLFFTFEDQKKKSQNAVSLDLVLLAKVSTMPFLTL